MLILLTVMSFARGITWMWELHSRQGGFTRAYICRVYLGNLVLRVLPTCLDSILNINECLNVWFFCGGTLQDSLFALVLNKKNKSSFHDILFAVLIVILTLTTLILWLVEITLSTLYCSSRKTLKCWDGHHDNQNSVLPYAAQFWRTTSAKFLYKFHF